MNDCFHLDTGTSDSVLNTRGKVSGDSSGSAVPGTTAGLPLAGPSYASLSSHLSVSWEQHQQSPHNVRVNPQIRFSDFTTLQAALDYIAECKKQSRRNSTSGRKSSGASFPGAGGRVGELFDPILFSYAIVWTSCFGLEKCAAELDTFSCKKRLDLKLEDIAYVDL